MNSGKKESLLSQRGQMAFWAIGLWVFLAAWSLSAFWQHIDTLKPTYQFAAKCGAGGGEFALLAFIILHCFNKHIGVRKWALILGFVLAAVIAAHSGALRGLNESEVRQADTEQRLAETLTQMSAEQSGNVAATSAKTGENRSQRERLALALLASAQQGKIAASAQEIVAKEIAGRSEKIKDDSIFPRWYLDGWMYSVIFILALAFSAWVFYCMMNREDIDADFDGVPDHQAGQGSGRQIGPGFRSASTVAASAPTQDRQHPKD
jgi:hypothetical protein